MSIECQPMTACCHVCYVLPSQDQFIAGSSGAAAGTTSGNDTAPAGYSDQYAPGYQAYDSNYPTAGKPSVAHV
jgi:hypothetical protein